MRVHKFLILCIMLFFAVPLGAQQRIAYNVTDSLVNDYSGMLTWLQRDSLERRLDRFDDTTSNQILIIITPRLYGEDIIDLGVRIGHDWGVGQAELDNGVVILIKSKCDEEPFGDAAIVTGLGLEGVLPDAFCSRIIDDLMVPHLADTDYFSALTAALDVIERVCHGEYNYHHYQNEHARKRTPSDIASDITLWLFVALGVSYVIMRIRNRGKQYQGDSDDYSSSSDDHSYSSRNDSSSDRGFSGFGGGDFGGGGAHSRF